MLAKARTRAPAARATAKPAVAGPATTQRSLLAATAGALLLSLAPAPADARLPPEYYRSSNNVTARSSKNVESYQEALASRGVAAPSLNSSGEQTLAGFDATGLTRAAGTAIDHKPLTTTAAVGN